MPVTNPVFKRLNNHIKVNFGAIVTNHLATRGIKHNFVARQIGVKPEYFHRVLKGQDFLGDEALYKLAELLGMELEALLFDVYYSQNLADYVESESE
jgi:plasmid maintenance system antidote protein VapI